MNKRFKVRAWHKSTSTMYATVYYNDGEEVCVQFPIPDELCVRGMCSKEKDFVLMLCIGWTDRYGRDIFEGDILEDDNGDRFIIRWDADDCRFCFDDLPTNKYDPDGFREGALSVIGNIYNNPKLVEVEND